METYEDILNGTGFIGGWPGMHSHGSRIIRDKATHEIVDVLPPLSVELAAQAQEQPVSSQEDMSTQPLVETPVQETQGTSEAVQEQPVPPVEA